MSERLDITTILLSEQEPRQTAAGASGMAYQEGDFVTIFKCDDGFGYCYHGVGRDGNAYESEDVTGFATLAEAVADARASYEAEEPAWEGIID